MSTQAFHICDSIKQVWGSSGVAAQLLHDLYAGNKPVRHGCHCQQPFGIIADFLFQGNSLLSMLLQAPEMRFVHSLHCPTCHMNVLFQPMLAV